MLVSKDIGRTGEYLTLTSKTYEADDIEAAVELTYATVPDATEGQEAVRDMHDRVVDAAAAERDLSEHLILHLRALREEIEGKRLRASPVSEKALMQS